MPTDDADRAIAWSQQLANVHNTLRRQIVDLRADLGRHHPVDDSLLTHCVGFCAALTTHHHGEDDGMFAELLRIRPDLDPVVGNLIEDHVMIAAIVTRIRDLADRAASAVHDVEAFRQELDGLMAIMESHFNYEERAIGRALDKGLSDTGWTQPVFGPAGVT